MEDLFRPDRPLFEILAPVAALLALAAAGVALSRPPESGGLELHDAAPAHATAESVRDAGPLPRQWRWRGSTVDLGTMIRDGASHR